MQLLKSLNKISEWQYDAFELEEVSNGRPLSCLAFYIMKKMDLVRWFHLDEHKLARFLLRIEQGYPNNP